MVAYDKPRTTPDLNLLRLSQLEAQMCTIYLRTLVVAVAVIIASIGVVVASMSVVIVTLVLMENVVNLATNLVHKTARLGS